VRLKSFDAGAVGVQWQISAPPHDIMPARSSAANSNNFGLHIQSQILVTLSIIKMRLR